MGAIGLEFPFNESFEGGVFKTTKTTQDRVRVNLTYLLTSKRGERPMRSNFYSPLFDFIGEPIDEITANEIKRQLEDKIYDFMPDISLKRIEIDETKADENILSIKIVYSIISLGGLIDEIEVNLEGEI